MSSRKTFTPEEILPRYTFAFYQVSINEAARSAVAAFMEFGAAVNNDDVPSAARHLSNAMSHCGALSRFFWPPKSAGSLAEYRGSQLRGIYKLNSNSALADRNMRNAFEHFDERIDNWLKEFPVGPIIASPILADHSEFQDDFGHAFKVIDPDASVCIVLGQRFEFGKLAKEVADLLMRMT